MKVLRYAQIKKPTGGEVHLVRSTQGGHESVKVTLETPDKALAVVFAADEWDALLTRFAQEASR